MAIAGVKGEEVLLSLRVIAAEVSPHLTPGVHPWCQRNGFQYIQNPAHRYSLHLPNLGVNRLAVPHVLRTASARPPSARPPSSRSDVYSLARASRHRLGPPTPRAVRLALCRRYAGLAKKDQEGIAIDALRSRRVGWP